MEDANPINRVLIWDADSTHLAELKDALRKINCRLSLCSDSRTAIEILQREPIDVVVMVPELPSFWKKDAEAICEAVGPLEDRPQVVCILRAAYKGPSDRLLGDKLKIRIIYEI
jgi:DNA-binding response OmpR family regulator